MKVDNDTIVSVSTNRGTVYPKVVINAAGVYADKVAEMAGDQFFTIHPRKGETVFLDSKKGYLLNSIVAKPDFKTFGSETKGGGLVKTIDGNILVGPDAYEQPYREDYTTNRVNIEKIIDKHLRLIPNLSSSDVITYCAGIRASTYEEDFIIEQSEYVRNFIYAAGIQSPGLASAPAIAEDIEAITLRVLKNFMEVKPKESWNPYRRGIPDIRRMDNQARDDLIRVKPDYGVMLKSFVGNQPLKDSSYWMLIAANVGAVIMPWMIFYQQGAVVDKGLNSTTIKFSRIDTLLGSITTQVIMGAVLILAAATIGKINPNVPLADIQQIASALEPFVGAFAGKMLFAIGVTSAALVAAIVVSLATSWAFGEVMGIACSLNCTLKQAPVFYGLYSGGIIFAAFLVMIGIPLVSLTVAVEIMNTLLLPIVLGFLLALGWKALPREYKLKQWEKIILVIIYILVCSLGLYTVISL
jgi:hypothetical protein